MISRPQISRIIPVLVAVCVAHAGCTTSPVSLEPRSIALPAASKISRPVAFLHTPEFRGNVQTIEPYGNKYYVPIKVGEAADRAFRAAYASAFATVVEVPSADAIREPSGPASPAAVLIPSVENLEYWNASNRMGGPYFAEVAFRFVLADPAGGQIAEWRVKGFGEYESGVAPQIDGQSAPRGETGMIVEAPRRAIEAAAASFAASLGRKPEIQRWSRGLPVAGSNAPSELQAVREISEAPTGSEATYPGVLTLQVRLLAVSPTAPGSEQAAQISEKLFPLRIELRNDSSHRLALDPADIEWIVDEGSSIETLPGQAASAALAGHPFGLQVGVASPGVGMLPALFAAIVNVAETASHKRALDQWNAMIEGGILRDGICTPGETRSGSLFFPLPPKSTNGTLVIPVIDLDDAVRYTVRVPMAARAQPAGG